MRKRVIGRYLRSNPKIDVLSRDENGAIVYHGSTNWYSHVSDAVESFAKRLGRTDLFGCIDKRP